MCLKINELKTIYGEQSWQFNKCKGWKEKLFCLYVFKFIFTRIADCPALWSHLSFTKLWPCTETYEYWLPVIQCFMEKSILGTGESTLYSKGVISLYKVLGYLGVFIRETHICWEEGECIWGLVPYGRSSAKESSIECMMKYTFWFV